MEESRKVYGWLVRGRNAAAGCSSMWTGTRGRENYCGNLLWQSSLTLLFLDPVVSAAVEAMVEARSLDYTANCACKIRKFAVDH